ncbi:hypothetical protein COB55_05575 [Candidatus Wolfebacteria bacterium]|nr:MAG: hypothetical protein COB55_05575 [Candidatus Wolfebacteria bacterium]
MTKKKKIVVLGGSGYIGTQLCELYKNETHKYNITVIDNRFISERVKQLNEWGMRFIQGSILDEKLMKEQLKDCDFCFHLAGQTVVPSTKSDSNPEWDKQIIETGTKGSKIVIDSMGPNCKIIFPSTHVVFEGLKETVYDIDENHETCPVLSYSKSKVETEEYLKSLSDKNYIILRLSSAYGIVHDSSSMRLNVLPNLFAKMTSQGQTLKLYSKGVQLKSLVSINDICRSMKFFMSQTEIKREIFNISNENMTIKQLSELCQKIKPSIEIIETNDKIPNLGYSMDNSKLKNTGFSFQSNIEDELREMINYWSFDKKKMNNSKVYSKKEEFEMNKLISPDPHMGGGIIID